MPTQLTNPVQTTSTHATLDGWELVVVRNGDLTVNVAESYILASFTFRGPSGVTSKQRLTRRGNELPPAVTAAVVGLQNALLTAARNAGILPAGTDTPDF